MTLPKFHSTHISQILLWASRDFCFILWTFRLILCVILMLFTVQSKWRQQKLITFFHLHLLWEMPPLNRTFINPTMHWNHSALFMSLWDSNYLHIVSPAVFYKILSSVIELLIVSWEMKVCEPQKSYCFLFYYFNYLYPSFAFFQDLLMITNLEHSVIIFVHEHYALFISNA